MLGRMIPSKYPNLLTNVSNYASDITTTVSFTLMMMIG